MMQDFSQNGRIKDMPAEGRPSLVFCEQEMYDKQESKEETVLLVVLRLSSEWYGVDILKTREIVLPEKITFLPSAPAFVEGVINLRGNILAVTNLKKVFGLPAGEVSTGISSQASSSISSQTKIVVLQSGVLETGLLADEVTEIVEVPVKQIEPPLATLSPEKAAYIQGECRLANRFIGVLNVEKILSC